MEFIEANIAKFYDFLSQIIKNSNDAKGIIATLSNQRIRVIYDYKYIHDDYGNFDCAELYDKQIAYHYFVYELNKEKDSNFSEQTIDNFNFVSKYNNIITLRITMENVKQLYFMLRDSKLTALQLKAENYNNYKIFSEEKTENSKYKTILSIKDINEDSTINTVSSNLSILIKAVKKQNSEKFLEILMKFYVFQDIEQKKDNPYMVKSFSIPITMLNANQNEEDYN